jgi:hypothetical protein
VRRLTKRSDAQLWRITYEIGIDRPGSQNPGAGQPGALSDPARDGVMLKQVLYAGRKPVVCDEVAIAYDLPSWRLRRPGHLSS